MPSAIPRRWIWSRSWFGEAKHRRCLPSWIAQAEDHIIATRTDPAFILTLSCRDRVGIVAAVSGHLADIDGFIVDSQQYADLETARFFLRIAFTGAGPAFPTSPDALRAGFAPVGEALALDWALVPATQRPRLLVAVSKASHCLNDLLHRWQTGSLPVDVAGVVSNHPDLRR